MTSRDSEIGFIVVFIDLINPPKHNDFKSFPTVKYVYSFNSYAHDLNDCDHDLDDCDHDLEDFVQLCLFHMKVKP